jgi:gas vesicle protein
MANLDKDTKTLLTGAVIGGVIGFCASSLLKKGKKEKSVIESLGKAVVHIGEILNKDTAKIPGVHAIGKKIHKHEDAILDIVELISTGISLWEKFKKEV